MAKKTTRSQYQDEPPVPEKIRKLVKPGTRLTVLHEIHAYYSQYNGNPPWVFRPGMVAIVHTTAPKVMIRTGQPHQDEFVDFVVADYDDNGVSRRVGINFRNVVLLDK